MTSNVQERLLTTREAAQWFRVHPATIRRWVHRGDVASVTIGEGRRQTLRVVAEDRRPISDDAADVVAATADGHNTRGAA